MRVTPKQLKATVERLQRAGFDISIAWAYGRPRVHSLDESRDISPRLSCGEMATWLDGFEAGIREHEHWQRIQDAMNGN